jgi:hypothetical protein
MRKHGVELRQRKSLLVKIEKRKVIESYYYSKHESTLQITCLCFLFEIQFKLQIVGAM